MFADRPAIMPDTYSGRGHGGIFEFRRNNDGRAVHCGRRYFSNRIGQKSKFTDIAFCWEQRTQIGNLGHVSYVYHRSFREQHRHGSIAAADSGKPRHQCGHEPVR